MHIFRIITNTSNNQNNGSISVSITGGTIPYTYLWSNSSTSPAIYNLSSGTYYLTYTDFNDCGGTDDPYYILSSLPVPKRVIINDVKKNGAKIKLENKKINTQIKIR
jgi:hypothetical protein